MTNLTISEKEWLMKAATWIGANLTKTRMVNPDFEEDETLYRGYSDKEIAINYLLSDAEVMDCRDCPHFMYCEAMDYDGETL